MLKKTLIIALPLAILAGGWLLLRDKKDDITAEIESPHTAALTRDDKHQSKSKNPVDAPPNSAKARNDLSLPAETDQVAPVAAEDLNVEPQDDNAVFNNTGIEATSIALSPLSDEEFEKLERLVKVDSNLRMDLLEEFRYTTDPRRSKQLASLLGPYNDAAIVQVASELAYSGDPVSRRAGLSLLGRLQPHSTDARDVVIDLLGSEDDAAMLVTTMNTLATPAKSANSGQRQLLSDNLINLSRHQDARVRSHSISLIGRWDRNSPASIETLTRGLSDPNPSVRSSATYAANNVQNPGDEMIGLLLGIAEDVGEKKSNRHAAIDALGNMTLSGNFMRRFNVVKVSVNRRQ